MYSVSPRELFLEHENARLRGLVQELERYRPAYFGKAEPVMQQQDFIPNYYDVRMLKGAEVYMASEPDEDKLHVLITDYMCKPEQPVKLAYFLSQSQLHDLSSEQKASMIADMHEEVMFKLGQHYWK